MAFLLLLVLLLGQDLSTFRSDVALVHIDAEVRQDGKSIEDLDRESFRLTDRGKPQDIVYFSREQEPLDVVLLFDVSAETRPAIQRVSRAAHAVVSDLRQGDRIAVVVSGRAQNHCMPSSVVDLTNRFDDVEESIRNQVVDVNFRVQTRSRQILAGIDGAAKLFLHSPSGNRRRAIIAITDDQGAGTGSGLVKNTVRDLWNADAVVLGVLVHSGNSTVSVGPTHRGARYAAAQTGGDVLKTDDAMEAIHEVFERLRLRYSLFYALPKGKPGEERKIAVSLVTAAFKRYPRATIRARGGYVMP